jgi:excinuclease ABC subunit C
MKGIEVVKIFQQNLPEKSGIYKFISDEGNILYIGKAKNLKKRVSYYTKEDIPTRLARMVFLCAKAEYIITKTEAEAFLLEASQIKLHKPRFNILLKDDKSFPYIKITLSHQYPQILKFRGKKTKDDSLFGPFASSSDIERTLSVIKKIFKIRTCSDNYFESRKRPCLQYQIGRCSAPCVSRINDKDYFDDIKNTVNFLSGKASLLQKNLSEKMQKYSDDLNFEKAAEVRDSIKALTYIQTRGGTDPQDCEDIDIIVIKQKSGFSSVLVSMYRAGQNYGFIPYFPKQSEDASMLEVLSGFIGQFYQTRPSPANILTNIKLEDEDAISEALQNLHNSKTKFISPNTRKYKGILEHAILNLSEVLDKKISHSTKHHKILNEVKELLELESQPTRIEVYDNSHIMGKFAVGAMVVAGTDGFEKNEYRKYTIQSNHSDYGGDDYQMLKEVMIRRIKKLKENPEKTPSLIIIDGGKGHYSSVERIFAENNITIPFICMSKGEKRDAGGENFHYKNKPAFTLDNNTDIMKYFQILRDEVHNFAITSHRKKRSKAISTSLLDSVPQIGVTRKKSLLNYFGSVESIKNSTIEDLCKAPGISLSTAKTIFEYFNE